MFISSARADGWQDRSPYGDFWFQPAPGRFGSSAVSADTAMTLAAVWRGVNLISSHIAMLPLRLRKEGGMEQVHGHWVQKLLKKPNAWQNGFEWRQMMQAWLMLRGNAYNQIVDDERGRVVALLPRHPDYTTLEPLPNGDWQYKFRDPKTGTVDVVPRGQVWHLRGLSNNGMVGMSVIAAARESLGLGLSAQRYGARYFDNDARPSGGWIEFSGKFADKEARRVWREQFQEQQSGENKGKTLVLDMGMKYHDPVGISAADSQFLETRKFQIPEVARWLGLPAHKLYDLSAATNNNIEQQALEYISDTLLLWAELWEAGIEDVLLFDSEGLEPEFDFGRLERADSKTRAEVTQKQVYAGTLTRNEGRAVEGRGPLPGLVEPLVPVNMMAASRLELGQGGGAKPSKNKRQPPAAPLAPQTPPDED